MNLCETDGIYSTRPRVRSSPEAEEYFLQFLYAALHCFSVVSIPIVVFIEEKKQCQNKNFIISLNSTECALMEVL